MKEVLIGREYRHYKGGKYKVVHLGKIEATKEDAVVYLNSSGDVWIRPVTSWNETVELNGATVDRFALIEN